MFDVGVEVTAVTLFVGVEAVLDQGLGSDRPVGTAGEAEFEMRIGHAELRGKRSAQGEAAGAACIEEGSIDVEEK